MMSEENILENFDEKSIELLNKLCKLHPNFGLDNVVSILPKLISNCNKSGDLDADDKKLRIVNMIKYIIENTDGPGDDDVWDPILISLVPSTVDMLINVSNGTVKLDENKQKIKSLLGCCKGKKNLL